MRFRKTGENRKELHQDDKWLAITTTKRQTLHPVWNEQFTLPCPFEENVELELKVEDWDRVGGNDFLGRVYVSLADLNPQGRVDKRIHVLLDKEGKHDMERGHIEVAMRWTYDPLWQEINKIRSPEHAHSQSSSHWHNSFVNWANTHRASTIDFRSTMHSVTQRLLGHAPEKETLIHEKDPIVSRVGTGGGEGVEGACFD
mmetsp:Transcript_25896/g.33701  ORF Transcript_25896/g.33701 Transcript_25896/m.33701 type:complete len:200 (-) Transcript_25896:27-626(-)